jgi:hypothetical protein
LATKAQREAERALREALVRARGKAGRSFLRSRQALVRELDRVERALLDLAPKLDRTRSRATAQRLLERTLADVFPTAERAVTDRLTANIRAVAEGVVRDIERATLDLYRAAKPEGVGRVATRFGNLPQDVVRGRVSSSSNRGVPRLVAKRTDAARREIAAFVRDEYGTRPSRRTLEAVAKLMAGEAPVDLPGLRKDPRLKAVRSLRSDLERVVSSETFSTMRDAAALSTSRSGVVLVARWTLSERHKVKDACDDLASANIGWGRGYYPPERWPSAPHPYCACYQSDTKYLPPARWP